MQRDVDVNDEPLDRLFKLLPAESTGAFMLIRGIFPTYDKTNSGLDQVLGTYYFLTFLIIILTPVLLVKVWKMKHWPTVCFLTATLVVWIANIEINRFVDAGQFIGGWAPQIFNPYLAKGMLIIWAIMLVPMVIPAKKGREHDQ